MVFFWVVIDGPLLFLFLVLQEESIVFNFS
jgi:hypothetical protein